MGWASCGKDSKGRPIGYAHEATCDEPGCDEKIDRGLGYACGEMHGADDPEGTCEGYFCGKHLVAVRLADGCFTFACHQCAEKLKPWNPFSDAGEADQ